MIYRLHITYYLWFTTNGKRCKVRDSNYEEYSFACKSNNAYSFSFVYKQDLIDIKYSTRLSCQVLRWKTVIISKSAWSLHSMSRIINITYKRSNSFIPHDCSFHFVFLNSRKSNLLRKNLAKPLRDQVGIVGRRKKNNFFYWSYTSVFPSFTHYYLENQVHNVNITHEDVMSIVLTISRIIFI